MSEYRANLGGINLKREHCHLWHAMGAIEATPYTNADRQVQFGCGWDGRQREQRALAALAVARDELGDGADDVSVARRAVVVLERSRAADAMHDLAAAIRSLPKTISVTGGVLHVLTTAAAMGQ